MKIRFPLICLLSILLSPSLVAQKYKLLKGKVSHPKLSVAGIHVVNVSRGSTEITDMMGYFEISVAQGERLLFTGIQFKDQELIITEDIFSSDEITVYLKTAINQLDEVVVKPHDLSGNLSSDLQGVPKTLNFTDVGIPGFKGEREEKIVSGKSLILSTLLLPISGGLDVTMKAADLTSKELIIQQADFTIGDDLSASAGKKEFTFLGYSKSPTITISQDSPLPLKVLGLAMEIQFA